MMTSFFGGTEEDHAAIEDLHRTDAEASLRQDFRTLRRIMSDDPVVLAPGAKPMRGRAAIDASFQRQQDRPSPVEVVNYAFEWQEVQVVGDLAIEWGQIVGSTRSKDAVPETPPTNLRYNVLRVLRRQPDGWKVHRTIWNQAPAE